MTPDCHNCPQPLQHHHTHFQAIRHHQTPCVTRPPRGVCHFFVSKTQNPTSPPVPVSGPPGCHNDTAPIAQHRTVGSCEGPTHDTGPTNDTGAVERANFGPGRHDLRRGGGCHGVSAFPLLYEPECDSTYPVLFSPVVRLSVTLVLCRIACLGNAPPGRPRPVSRATDWICQEEMPKSATV